MDYRDDRRARAGRNAVNLEPGESERGARSDRRAAHVKSVEAELALRAQAGLPLFPSNKPASGSAGPVPGSLLAPVTAPELALTAVPKRPIDRCSAAALELYRAGVNDAQIARRLRLPRTAVRRWRGRLGLPRAARAC